MIRFLQILSLSALLLVPMTASAATELKQAIQKLGGNYREDLTRYYNDGAPLWLADGKPTRDANQVIDLLKEATWHGLNPENYGVAQLDSLKADPHLFEVAMSRAAIQFIRDMTGPRIAPSSIGLTSGSWLKAPAASVVLTTLSAADDKSEVVEKIIPKGKTYKRLQAELKDMAKDLQSPHEQVVVPFMGVLHVGDASPSIAALRRKFDLSARNGEAENVYDDRLAQKVMAVQKEYGLTPDGIIGSRTIRMINASGRARLEQVVANLEWMRWMDASAKGRAIIVNIPAMRLWALDDGRVKHEMSVVVGRPDRPTPVFATKVTGVRFNPNWTMPPRIKQEDYLPKLQEDPLALVHKGIAIQRVTEEGVESVAPDTVDWANITPEELNAMRFVQKPGSNNALGQVRLLMPNRYDVYLHDTNSPELFGRDGRMQSSGCVRMEKPLEIAAFVMDGTPDWTDEKMKSVLELGRTRDIPTANPVPIYILYQTIWPGEDGKLIMGDDIYSLDSRMVSALRKSGKFPPI